jgi:hypothetical protein
MIKIKITKKDLENYEKHQENIQDYPIYAKTSGLSRSEIVMLSKIMEYEFDNDRTMEITIK